MAVKFGVEKYTVSLLALAKFGRDQEKGGYENGNPKVQKFGIH